MTCYNAIPWPNVIAICVVVMSVAFTICWLSYWDCDCGGEE